MVDLTRLIDSGLPSALQKLDGAANLVRGELQVVLGWGAESIKTNPEDIFTL